MGRKHDEAVSERDRMEQAFDLFRVLPRERSISAMPVIVPYTAKMGRVEHFKRGDEHCFTLNYAVKQGNRIAGWQFKQLNAHAVRDEFLDLKGWSAAFDFLSNTGMFSPLSDTITLSEFEQWQDLARLVLEHSQLAAAMQNMDRTGKNAEALKALFGDYPTSFFKSELPPERHLGPIERELLDDADFLAMIEEGKRRREAEYAELLTWFRRPPRKACSIEWYPKEKKDSDAVLPRLGSAGAMIEFLLPRAALRPLLVIHPSTTLEAIAGTIFADYCNGVEYKTCDFCERLFPVGKQKTKKFCNKTKCKNAAHSKKVRKALRNLKEKAAAEI